MIKNTYNDILSIFESITDDLPTMLAKPTVSSVIEKNALKQIVPPYLTNKSIISLDLAAMGISKETTSFAFVQDDYPTSTRSGLAIFDGKLVITTKIDADEGDEEIEVTVTFKLSELVAKSIAKSSDVGYANYASLVNSISNKLVEKKIAIVGVLNKGILSLGIPIPTPSETKPQTPKEVTYNID
jgi:hypothetical protein